MIRIAHISDPHFGQEMPKVSQALTAELFRQTPDLTVISGDLTQRAATAEFRRAKDFVKGLPGPVLVIPGNHDLPVYNPAERLFSPWKKWRRHLGPDLEPRFETEDVLCLGANTARAMGRHLDWSRGRISRDQLARISREFAAAHETKLCILAAHHPFWLPKPYLHRHLIDNSRLALEFFRASGVDLILGGHIHLPYTRITGGIVVCQAGTAVSSRVLPGRTNSFNLITGNDEALSIVQMDWQGKRFAPAAVRDVIRRQGEWRTFP
ncbi:MAG TPA: restriction endonuclease subunit S [Desulfobacteraceae bacterium]|nr:restriction endonuclease subunit S [Desulfobacteraceae bacterium]